MVSLGALDMVNFGARDTVPPKFEDRNLYVHNPSVTLMRTTPEECAEPRPPDRRQAGRRDRPDQPVRAAGRGVADRRRGTAVPRPGADAALFDALREGCRGSSVELVELDANVNDEEFADAMVDKLDAYLGGAQ